MASVTRVTTSKGTRYRARYRDPAGLSKERWFEKRAGATAFLTTVEGAKLHGDYIDPQAGRTRFGELADGWLSSQTFGDGSRVIAERVIRVHLLPTFGDVELRAIKPSTVQAWLRGQQTGSSPTYIAQQLGYLSSILSAAVEDGLISRNPCASSAVRAPAQAHSTIVPWTTEMVAAMRSAMPERYEALVDVAAGLGLRQGEAFGLVVDDVDWLRRRVRIVRQVRTLGGRTTLEPPKGQRERTVPLPDFVGRALNRHADRHAPSADGVIFTNGRGGLIRRQTFNSAIWTPARVAASIPALRENGMHALRHHFASVLLDGGESIRTVADYLGHADPAFTLRRYAHLIPASEDRARRVLDAAFCGAGVGLEGSGSR